MPATAGNTLAGFLTVLPMLIGLYGFDAVRGLLLGTITLLPISVEVILIIASMFVMIGLGLMVLRALERRVRVRGTLGHH